MKHFRKIWDKEKHDWIFSHKDMNRNEAYKLFCQAFPDADISACGFFNERSRIGACHRSPHGSTKRKPLYSEQIKKGYVRIKIAQPNVWISKAKWVYMETHPWEDFSERSNYVFLDGNTRNFAPKNIERVPLKIMSIYCNLGGTEPGRPDITKLRIAQAKLKIATLDAGEKLGLVVDCGNGRRFRTDRNESARKYQQKPEVKARIKIARQKHYQKLKTENPEKWEEIQKKHKKYLKKYYQRKRGVKCL